MLSLYLTPCRLASLAVLHVDALIKWLATKPTVIVVSVIGYAPIMCER